MSGTIADREAELAALQTAFDEYITSSRELEEELDAELTKMQERLGESSSANAALSGQLENIAPQLHSLEKALGDMKSKYDEEAKLRREAEMSQDDAEARCREVEGSLLTLQGDCDEAHEELAFKESELDETLLELEIEQERNREEVDDLKADLSIAIQKGGSANGGGDSEQPEVKSNGTAATPKDDEPAEEPGRESRDDDYVQRLEDELEVVTEQLIETEQCLSETEEQLVEAEREITKISDTNRELMAPSSFDEEEKKKDGTATVSEEEIQMLKESEVVMREELDLIKEELTLTQEELVAAEDDVKRSATSLEVSQTQLRQQVSKITEQLHTAEGDAKASTTEVETLENILITSTAENEELNDQVANLNTALENAKADREAIMEELDAVNERFDAVRDEAESAGRESAAVAIKRELESAHTKELKELRKLLEVARAEKNGLQQQVDDVEMEMASTKDLKATSESNEKNKGEMVIKLQTQLARTKDSVASKDKEIQELKWALETRVAKAEDDVTLLEKELSSTKGKLAEAEAHLIVSRRDKERALAKTLQSAKAAKKKTHPKLTGSLEEDELEVSSEHAKVIDLQKKNDELKNQNRMSEIRVKRLEEDHKALQEQLFGDAPVVTQLSRLSTMGGPNKNNAQEVDVRDMGSSQVEDIIETRDVRIISDELRSVDSKFSRQREYNSKLLSKILSLQGNIQVCCRVRPLSMKEIKRGQKGVVESLSESEVGCKDPRINQWKSFGFDKVWGPDQTQQSVFQDVEPLALSVVDGYNACIFAYGQTGSGKTYTMEGIAEGNDHGISYRTTQKIFNLLNLRAQQQKAASNLMNDRRESPESSKFEFSLSVGMLEIYNDEVYDLLSDLSGGATVADKQREARKSGGKATLEIRRNADGVIEVPNLTKQAIINVEDMMTLLKRGNSNRATATTDLNEHSSRSHMVLTVDVSSGLSGTPGNKGNLFLVDLAGSERVRKSNVHGEHLKEAGHINKSLAALGNVMEALDRKAKHVPYRDSKLTYLLQDSLGGNSRTMMVVAVCPMDTAFDESIHALQFATRVRRIQIGAAHRNATSRNLEETVKSLTSEMRMLTKAKEKSETQLHSFKRDNTRIQEKLQHISESRKTSQAENRTVEVLRKNNSEMANRWQKEKTLREKSSAELEKIQTESKRTQMQFSKNKREIESLTTKLKEKDTLLSQSKNDLRKAKEAVSASNIRARTAQIIGSRGTGRNPESPNKSPRRPTTARASINSTAKNKPGQGTDESFDASEIREEVLALLEKHDTTKVGRIDIIMERFKGKENLLLEKMTQRYERGGDAAQTSSQRRNEMALERHSKRMQSKVHKN